MVTACLAAMGNLEPRANAVRSGDLKVREARAEDYDDLVAVVDEWWGRPVSAALPRLFLDHFWPTSFIAEDGHGLAGFLVGFVSPARPDEAYVHFVAVRPDQRGRGLARLLYARFEQAARARGCRVVRAITAPANGASVAFHQHLGFAVSGPVEDYNGRGRPMMVFSREVSER
jgi:ribosomal protein S18 acetylase RimI-like enzyme